MGGFGSMTYNQLGVPATSVDWSSVYPEEVSLSAFLMNQVSVHEAVLVAHMLRNRPTRDPGTQPPDGAPDTTNLDLAAAARELIRHWEEPSQSARPSEYAAALQELSRILSVTWGFGEHRRGSEDPEAGRALRGVDADRTCAAEALTFKTVFAVVRLMWPRFNIHRGCVLAADFSSLNVDHWWDVFGGDTREIEGMVNHLHLWDLLNEPDDPNEDDEKRLRSLGNDMVVTWDLALSDAFPSREFEVRLTEDADEDYGPTVTFFSRYS